MANIFDALLNPEEDFAAPETRAATAAALRRQNALGVLGQVMATKATAPAGQALQESAQGSLKAAIAKQHQIREDARRAEERKADEEWRRMNYDATLQNRREVNLDRDLSRDATAANRAETQAARDLAAAEKAEKTAFDQGTQLRGEYDKKLQAMTEGVANAQTLMTLSVAPDVLANPQAQTAMVFAFGKALDSNSTVRESEYKLFEEARGMLASWGMTPERIASGARLTATQIKQMTDVAKIIVGEVAPRRAALDERYYNLAVNNKLDPVKYGLPTPPKKEAPKEQATGTAQNPIKVTRAPAAGAAPAPPAANAPIPVDY